ncbi:uncharacterized protein C8Q71DRAFT_439424 [Rhodofomes roseus]|uniref:Uncharacterized protein n=1 Tax=Rhodofomes roseus TaxID=34475 RepID=A0ABQ8KRQ8_9APHY|nr:uncharacterized protein C8Q71DRAFT_439424 [Rhodofomes roseus]KAH9841108.1 hypothetical protein C8Q71DRAFT_439424 [Rhodofomes roseus]
MSLPRSSIASFTLPSLDPPGEKRALPAPYNQPPFKRGELTNAVLVKRVSSMNPLPRLHRSLIPDLKATWKPPVLYYGWSIGDLLPRLVEYAEQHKLARYTVIGRVHKPTTPWGEKLYSSDSEDPDSDGESAHWGDTDEEDEEEESGVYVDEAGSANIALYHMAKEAGIDMRHLPITRRPFGVCGALHYPHKLVISIYSNYELAWAIPQDDIEKMQKYLGIQETPAWYVSNMDATWSRFTPRW